MTGKEIYIDGQPVERIADGTDLETLDAGYYADDLPAIVTADRAEFTGTVSMTPEQAARMIELVSPYSRDFAEAFHETVLANPKRWHIYGHTKRARIRHKQYKSFVTELIARMEAKAKAREDHATL
jgi:hypothetical protein